MDVVAILGHPALTQGKVISQRNAIQLRTLIQKHLGGKFSDILIRLRMTGKYLVNKKGFISVKLQLFL